VNNPHEGERLILNGYSLGLMVGRSNLFGFTKI